MKFKKLLFGLAGFPLLLASCSNSMNWKAAKQWVDEHYKSTEGTEEAIAEVEWNYSTTVGDDANKAAIAIYTKLKEEATYEQIAGLADAIPLDKIEKSKTGKIRHMNPLEITKLTTANFSSIYREEDTKNVYKVNGLSFSGTYNIDLDYLKGGTIGATCIRVYNARGYCTDFGFKANKTLDKNNVIKVKLLVHFLYEQD